MYTYTELSSGSSIDQNQTSPYSASVMMSTPAEKDPLSIKEQFQLYSPIKVLPPIDSKRVSLMVINSNQGKYIKFVFSVKNMHFLFKDSEMGVNTNQDHCDVDPYVSPYPSPPHLPPPLPLHLPLHPPLVQNVVTINQG